MVVSLTIDNILNSWICIKHLVALFVYPMPWQQWKSCEIQGQTRKGESPVVDLWQYYHKQFYKTRQWLYQDPPLVVNLLDNWDLLFVQIWRLRVPLVCACTPVVLVQCPKGKLIHQVSPTHFPCSHTLKVAATLVKFAIPPPMIKIFPEGTMHIIHS